ncbi:baseplate J/gp47 family protein [Sphingomonas sp. HF-S4]|uniref:Baseplate J/gp47 family protein n=1 Tax=Sphingomonas agrestis TaxID=3080540 RepID=A0ABU3Y203_9SPHN|nr:baseplate J/gp47 family protein [Sphingomonas sp. HF-S4]MDV3455384.1 baseplate J/gp47 family protein [Sphingomonas sp. HF-S4]
MLEELRGGERDGTSQRGRLRAELAPDYVRLDERSPADMIAFAQAYAEHLLWYDPDGEAGVADGNWAPMFAGLAANPGEGLVSHAEAAAFAADPGAFLDPRFATLRKPHMMLLLACVRLLRHGQDAINAVADRHYEHQLREVLRLEPAPARPDRAFVLFELAAGIAAAEAPEGLRLLAGRDARRRDRVYRLDDTLVVNRARVAALATSMVDREVVGLAEARHAEPGTPEEKSLALLRLAYGVPRPSDPLPPLRGSALTAARWRALVQLLAFSRATLRLEFFELRTLVARKRRRDGADADWNLINTTLQTAGRAKRGDPRWQLAPADARDFAANFLKAYDGDPMKNNGLEEVATVDDLMLHLDRRDVRAFIETKLFLTVDRQFVPMMDAKRAADADWRVINGFLEVAGRRMRSDPAWAFAPTAPTAFDTNLKTALGAIDWATAGTEATGVTSVGSYLDRIAEIEAWFFLAAEKLVRLLPILDAPDHDPAWADAQALLAEAHARKVRNDERVAMRGVREASGVKAALAAATGEAIDSPALLDTLARYASAAEVALVRTALDGSADPATLGQVDEIHAASRRRRLALPEPVAERTYWHALWAEADAPAAAGEGVAWPSFGAIPKEGDAARRPSALGWAIASPALALSTGRRRIVLTLAFYDDQGGALLDPTAKTDVPLKQPFALSLSAGKEWLAIEGAEFTQVRYADTADIAPLEPAKPLVALRIAFTLDESDPATAPPLAGPTDPRWPVLRLELRPVWNGQRFETAYARFRTLRLARAHLRVVVGRQDGKDAPGLWPLDLETDHGRADGKKPFEPFGSTAPPGAELAIGHPDLLNKRLTSLTLRWQWQGAPANLAAHYANYPARTFTAQFALVDGRVRTTALGAPQPLFGADPNAAMRGADLTLGTAAPADRVVEPDTRSVRDRRRYLVMTLAGTGFGHLEYPGLSADKAIALAAALRNGPVTDTSGYIVRPPYTPKLKQLQLDFAATHEVVLNQYRRADAVDRLYHLHPFGVVEAPDKPEGGWTLLPAYDAEGALYVGLDRVAAPQAVSLLFETVPGGGSEDRPVGLRWSYLDAGGWTDLPEQPHDTTLGLARAGLIRFDLPDADPDGRMPHGPYWLRATVDSGAASASALAGVHAQAASATFLDDGAPPEHYAAPLPAGTIRTIADSAPGLLKVVQPYAAFGGAPAEGDAGFRVRAGERLRHKGRALTAWDYEHLVLARFPEVHKVKCLPATMSGGPGNVRLILVPDIQAHRLADPFTPRAPSSLLDEVRDYLQPLAPSVARIAVGHPHFVRVRVRVGVRFRSQADVAFEKRRLNDAINRHLAPWAYEEGAEVALGQRIDATALVAFIDGLPYVDFVGGCRLFQSDDGEEYRPGPGSGEASSASRPDAVLTPAPRHEIDIIDDNVFVEQRFTGIGYMKIELDLVVS